MNRIGLLASELSQQLAMLIAVNLRSQRLHLLLGLEGGEGTGTIDFPLDAPDAGIVETPRE